MKSEAMWLLNPMRPLYPCKKDFIRVSVAQNGKNTKSPKTLNFTGIKGINRMKSEAMWLLDPMHPQYPCEKDFVRSCLCVSVAKMIFYL